MATNPYILMQLEDEVQAMEVRRTNVFKAVEAARERIMLLREKELFLEITFVNAQIVEKWIHFIIEGYRTRRRMLRLLKTQDTFSEASLTLRGEKTLGQLIRILQELSVDPILLANLISFNAIRKEAVHHLFDGAKELTEFDTFAKEYYDADMSKNKTVPLYVGIDAETKRITKDIERIFDTAKNT